MNKWTALILAAGEGKRMKSDVPKVLHKICGKALLEWVCETVKYAGIDECISIVGHKHEKVEEYMGNKTKYILQNEQLGTGHAVMQAEKILSKKKGNVIVLSGDVPLITADTVKEFINFHETNKNAVTVLTADYDDPTGYGRIVRDNNSLIKIVEEKDASISEKKIKEINSGIYCFNIEKLLFALSKIDDNNNQKEYYLTDTIEILIKSGEKAAAYRIIDESEIFGVNSRQHLAIAEKEMKNRILNKHMDNGVTIMDPFNTYINGDVNIGRDTVIYPGVFLESGTEIGNNCDIGPNTKITNCKIADNTQVQFSVLADSEVLENTRVGPFAYIRPGSKIGKNVKIGDFVEVKNSVIGDNTKVSHLTYIGDAELGKNVNMGCGSVIVNYDGEEKHKTYIKDNAFVGCNVNLISPVKINKNAYVAAGSTITDDVPENSLAIARERQIVKEGWNKNRRGAK
jgi:bifunctional UDP-N-acetylglucosamine pyrophosphorylase/glucosamine-1-phosphate N-acetyltransferase